MITVTQLQGLRGKDPRAAGAMFSALSTAIPGMSPNTLSPSPQPGTASTTPTVVVVAEPPRSPPPEAPVITFPQTADAPVFTPIVSASTSKRWVPWAVGGGVVAAIGAALLVTFANR